MLSRARKLATLAALLGWLGATPAWAQSSLQEGKSPGEIFAGTCSACHKSPRGLVKTLSPGSVSGFLRQHYTTGSEMASMLANYVTVGKPGDPPNPTRLPGAGKPDGKPDSDAAPSQQAARKKKPAPAAAPGEEGQPASIAAVNPAERAAPSETAGKPSETAGKPKAGRKKKGRGESEPAAAPKPVPETPAPAPVEAAPAPAPEIAAPPIKVALPPPPPPQPSSAPPVIASLPRAPSQIPAAPAGPSSGGGQASVGAPPLPPVPQSH